MSDRFRTYRMSFNNDLKLMSNRTKEVFFLVENLFSRLKDMNQPYRVHLSPLTEFFFKSVDLT